MLKPLFEIFQRKSTLNITNLTKIHIGYQIVFVKNGLLGAHIKSLVFLLIKEFVPIFCAFTTITRLPEKLDY